MTIDVASAETNIVCFEVNNAAKWVSELKDRGVLANTMSPTTVRLVTHKDVGDEDIRYALLQLADVAGRLAG